MSLVQPAKMPSLRSILNRTQFLILLSIMLIGGSAISFISFYTLERYSNKNSLLIADTVRHRVDAAVVFRDIDAIQDAIEQVSQGQEVNKIQVLDQGERLLAEVDLRANQPKLWFEHVLFKNAQPTSVAITHQDKIMGWVRVYGSSKSMLSFAAQVFAAMIVTLLLILLCIAVLTYRAYHQIMLSFDRVNYTANLIKEQRAFNLRMPQDVFDELNQLGTTFNALLVELDEWHHDISHENKRLAHQARHDDLTGLANRAYFEEYLERLYEQSDQRDKIALFFIDGDGFKGVNDTYGHQAGDLVLIEMARRLSQYLRQHDFMARLGGDEFAVILPNISAVEHVLLVVQNVLNATHEPIYLPNGQSIYFSFSVGVAMSTDASTPQQLIHHADQAMYTAKASPEQRYFLYQQLPQSSPIVETKYGY